MIPYPQRSYVLELFVALGSATENFVLAGAQALKFHSPKSRATRDFDFVLDAVALRQADFGLARILESLQYQPVPEAQRFQFSKPIPNSAEVMRIEFMAPAEYKRQNDFRVDIQQDIHAHACEGGSVVLAESDPWKISGSAPDGREASAFVRVTRPTALVMMKLLALHDRYQNLRGIQQREHDRNEARIHAADVVDILRAQRDMNEFRRRFLAQFAPEPHLKDKIRGIVQDYFGGDLLRCLCDDGNSHYYNSCPDGEYDLTYSQFAYSNVVPFKDKSEVRTRDYVLSFPDTKIRYEILKERIENAWKEQFSSED